MPHRQQVGLSTVHFGVLETPHIRCEPADSPARVEATRQTLQPGGTLGNYRIEQVIGQGGNGLVLKAAHVATQKAVVIKVLRPERNSGGGRKSLAKEARILAGLNHPRVVRLVEFFEVDQYPVLVMEYVPGDTLAKRVAASGPLAPAHALRVTAQLVTALQAAWNQGVWHRDVKPENVVLDANDDATLIDFGSARELGGPQSAGVIGAGQTVAYMAPELYSEATPDLRSDIYALGATAFFALTGQLPYQACTPMEMMIQHTADPIPSSRRLASAIPPAFSRIICRMMAKHPARRPADYMALLIDLAAVADRMGVDTADWVPVWA